MGTVTPPSFCVPDVATWLCSKGYGRDCECVGFGRDGLGSVSIGRLRGGKQGPVARRLVQDGYQEVRVDRHSSYVGNPFCGAPAPQLCRAYDELMRAVLVTPLKIDEDLQHLQDPRHDAIAGQRSPAPWEQSLLHAIANKHEVLLHHQHVRPSDVRAWLVHYASLLLQGISLSLHCWCLQGDESSEPWVCHAQSLKGALLWVATTLRVELSAAGRCHPAEPDGPQVNAFSSYQSVSCTRSASDCPSLWALLKSRPLRGLATPPPPLCLAACERHGACMPASIAHLLVCCFLIWLSHVHLYLVSGPFLPRLLAGGGPLLSVTY